MGDRPVERVERPRDEGLYSARVEPDKKGKEKFSKTSPEREILFATFFSYLKKLFDAFSPSKELAGKVIDQQSIINRLQQLNKLLVRLGEKDLSTSSEYATELSDLWCLIVEDFEHVQIMERNDLKKIAEFRNLLESIKHYPKDSEHHLGYYLLQHTGKDWLPFPFIEMLEALHTEKRQQSEKNTLSKWQSEIAIVIKNLQSTLPFKL